MRSPDHPAMLMPAVLGPVKFEVRRSKGFEGMAAVARRQVPLSACSKARCGAEAANGFECKDGTAYLRILEFDVAKESLHRQELEVRARGAGQRDRRLQPDRRHLAA